MKYKIGHWGCGDSCYCGYFWIRRFNPNGKSVDYIQGRTSVIGSYDIIFESSWWNDGEVGWNGYDTGFNDAREQLLKEVKNMGLPLSIVENWSQNYNYYDSLVLEIQRGNSE